ncbi:MULTISPECIES: cytochrome b/b6 domain-containing protein [Alphaproteobacteria]|uniref:Cytochrome b561 n=2 Tax=Alphaproteobacteria TaxID=28211 RepID=A0A512HPW5_9HYPH|nr:MULTISPECIES: cytochrome b/b6 domain-containing protein [Alphaproteobacteria]GEO87497.1 cytochrome b561 [Ciceribacter naphthalenivorans]GLR24058.1 cytochrome b561 [Ciceribacter naphthalenivorans]GLT06914.1 cytochrome b561 [Sphingomonas psychrolutea]
MVERFVKIYPRFERFWHWTQVFLILVLMFTGAGLHGLHGLMPFGGAVMLHTLAALALVILWIFAIFWHLTTGTWRHYMPTTQGLLQVARFYAYGIFKGEHHPYRKAYWRKHNPMQALTYLALKLMLFPAIWLTGIAYLTYNLWELRPNAPFILEAVANLHLLVAYLIAAFVIVHVYLLTVGGSFVKHVKPMVTGFDTVDLTAEEEAYLKADEPGRIH